MKKFKDIKELDAKTKAKLIRDVYLEMEKRCDDLFDDNTPFSLITLLIDVTIITISLNLKLKHIGPIVDDMHEIIKSQAIEAKKSFLAMTSE